MAEQARPTGECARGRGRAAFAALVAVQACLINSSSVAALPLAAHAALKRATPSHVVNVAVIDADERRLIAGRYPWLRERIGTLVHGGTNSVCTAFCVAPDVVATAGHCVAGTVTQSAGNPADLQFRADNASGPGIAVKGARSTAIAYNMMTGSARLKTRPPINATSDWALLRLAKAACPANSLPFSRMSAGQVAAEAAAGRIYHVAYHRDLPHWKLAVAKGCLLVSGRKAGDPAQLARDFERADHLLLHTCDTESASSGSPLLVDGLHGPEVVGINVGTYVRSRVIAHDGQIVQRLDSEVIANTALLAAPLADKLDAFSRVRAVTDGPDMQRLQTALADLGHDPGPLDGVFGVRTRRAIEAYETRNGLSVTGIATMKLLQRLVGTTSASARH